MNCQLKFYGDPVLRETARPVETFDDELRELTRAMVRTMRTEAGIGLAAPQVGISRRLFVMEIPPEMDLDDSGVRLNPTLEGPLAVVNPELETFGDEEEMEEGCLSIPDIRGKVIRPAQARLRFFTPAGEAREIELAALAARCAQHEMDHLNGVLFVDRLHPVKRMAIRGKLRRLRQEQTV